MSEGESSCSPGLILDLIELNAISLANSIKKLGYEFEWIKDASDFDKAEVRHPYYVTHGPDTRA